MGKEEEQADPEIARTRSWLLGMLARISNGDAKATKLVVKHIDAQYEISYWARYWALEGLISGGNNETEAIAGRVASDKDRLVGMLATAYMASLNDRAAMKIMRANLDNPDTKWYVLRALRVIPLAVRVPTLCATTGDACYADEVYDAIIAVGNIPGEGKELAHLDAPGQVVI